ncbi:MAG: hypothetical protein ACRDKJ_04890 [Actinomycetota bacterium]
MPTESSSELLTFLVSRHQRAQRELDDLRQRGLEIVIAACVTELRGPGWAPSRAVTIDTSSLSEADVTSRPGGGSTAPADGQPDEKAQEPLPPEPDDAEGSWEWLAPEEPPPTLEDDVRAVETQPDTPAGELKTPADPPGRAVGSPKPASPVSPEPAAEDVRGAWTPPPSG